MGLGELSKAMNANKQPEFDSIGAEKLGGEVAIAKAKNAQVPAMHTCSINEGIEFFLSPNCPECRVVAAAHALKDTLEKLLGELQGWLVADRMVPDRVDEVARKEKWIRELQAALVLTEEKAR